MNGVLRSHGVTLVELLVVVSILGVVALVAIPDLSSGGAKRLDAATAEIVTALRYARSEALRTGAVHGIDLDKSNRRIVVFRANMATDPVSVSQLLAHPVDRKPWNFDLDTEAMTRGVSIGNVEDPFHFYPDFYLRTVLFDAGGAPVWIDTNSGIAYALLDSEVLLEYGALRRTVRLASLSGRVSVE